MMIVSNTILKILSDNTEAKQIDAVIRRGKIQLWCHTIWEIRKQENLYLDFQYHSGMSKKRLTTSTRATPPSPVGLACLGRTLLLTWDNCDYSDKTALQGRDYQPCLFRRLVKISLQSSLWEELQISLRLLITLHRYSQAVWRQHSSSLALLSVPHTSGKNVTGLISNIIRHCSSLSLFDTSANIRAVTNTRAGYYVLFQLQPRRYHCLVRSADQDAHATNPFSISGRRIWLSFNNRPLLS